MSLDTDETWSFNEEYEATWAIYYLCVSNISTTQLPIFVLTQTVMCVWERKRWAWASEKLHTKPTGVVTTRKRRKGMGMGL
jgi:hypothetical protein